MHAPWLCYDDASVMRRAVAILVACVMCAAGFLAWRTVVSQSSQSFRQALKTAATNPVEFAKNRFTGGIGVLLSTNQGSSFPVIFAVVASSPAYRTGLRAGDLIIKVDGLSTSNRPLGQVAEDMRGLSGGQVALTIQREGTADFECVIKRDSWNTLHELSRNSDQ